MSVLYYLESIRTDFLTALMSALTYLGHEVLPIAVICVFYWCVNKRLAYKIGFAFFASGLCMQTLKITFRIERPWVLDKTFNPVDTAKPAASGYSFPSGHTQAATSLYTSLSLHFRRWYVKTACVLAFLTVGFSRLYLGVHTPLDVGVSMAITLLLTLAIFPLMEKLLATSKYDIIIAAVMLAVSLGVLAYALTLLRMGKVGYENVADCFKSGGAGVGFALGFYIERRFVNFDTATRRVWTQLLKFALGIGSALLFKELLKLAFGENIINDTARYLVLVLWIIAGFPALFKLVSGRLRAKA